MCVNFLIIYNDVRNAYLLLVMVNYFKVLKRRLHSVHLGVAGKITAAVWASQIPAFDRIIFINRIIINNNWITRIIIIITYSIFKTLWTDCFSMLLCIYLASLIFIRWFIQLFSTAASSWFRMIREINMKLNLIT